MTSCTVVVYLGYSKEHPTRRQGRTKGEQSMNTVTIYYTAGNGNGWHWMLDRGNGCGMSSTEAFATAKEAEKVALSIAKCNEARYEGLLNEASLQQLFRENPRFGVVIADEPHEDRGTNWAYNGTYQASVERGW